MSIICASPSSAGSGTLFSIGSKRLGNTYAELVEVVLVFVVVDDDLTLVEEVEDLLEVEVVDDLIVDVVRVVELALVDVEEVPLAVAVAGGKVPDGAP